MDRKMFKALTLEINGCWEWQGTRSSRGYGLLNFEGHQWRAHRLAWRLFKRRSAEGLCVCHRCDNPCCVNPKHLFLGTHKDNAEDRERKGRHGVGNGFPKGGSHTAETRARMAASHTGLKHSAEHALRISEGQRRRWARIKGTEA